MEQGRGACLDLQALFDNKNPVEADMGCGKGAFLVQEAKKRPNVNFLGVDRLPRKLERTYRRMNRQALKNVRLFRDDVYHFADQRLPKASISVFYVFFPDPWPKKRHFKRRFFSPLMLKTLDKALKLNGVIWVATDHEGYFESILETFGTALNFKPLKEKKPNTTSLTDFEQEFMEKGQNVYRAGYKKTALRG